MISKPFLIIGNPLGIADASIGGYYGIFGLTSKKQQSNSETEIAKTNGKTQAESPESKENPESRNNVKTASIRPEK